MLLGQCEFQISSWSIFELESSFRLLMVSRTIFSRTVWSWTIVFNFLRLKINLIADVAISKRPLLFTV